MQEGGAQCSGKAVTLQMVNKWVAKVTKVSDSSFFLFLFFLCGGRCKATKRLEVNKGLTHVETLSSANRHSIGFSFLHLGFVQMSFVLMDKRVLQYLSVNLLPTFSFPPPSLLYADTLAVGVEDACAGTAGSHLHYWGPAG